MEVASKSQSILGKRTQSQLENELVDVHKNKKHKWDINLSINDPHFTYTGKVVNDGCGLDNVGGLNCYMSATIQGVSVLKSFVAKLYELLSKSMDHPSLFQ
eukprot:338643_1